MRVPASWTFDVYREPREPRGVQPAHRDWFTWRFLPKLRVSTRVVGNVRPESRWDRIHHTDLEDVIEKFSIAVVDSAGLAARGPKVKNLELIPVKEKTHCVYHWHTYAVASLSAVQIVRAYLLDDESFPIKVWDFRDHPHKIDAGDTFSFHVSMDYVPPTHF